MARCRRMRSFGVAWLVGPALLLCGACRDEGQTSWRSRSNGGVTLLQPAASRDGRSRAQPRLVSTDGGTALRRTATNGDTSDGNSSDGETTTVVGTGGNDNDRAVQSTAGGTTSNDETSGAANGGLNDGRNGEANNAGLSSPDDAPLPAGSGYASGYGSDFGFDGAYVTYDGSTLARVGSEGVAVLTAGYTTVVLRNVVLALDESVRVYVEHLEGVLLPRETGFVDLERPVSFQVVVEEALVWVSEGDLTELLDRYVFDRRWNDDSDFIDSGSIGGGFIDDGSWNGGIVGDGSDVPLREPEVSLEGGRVSLSGLVPGRWYEVEVNGYLEPTPSGDIALVPTALRREDSPADSLGDLFDEVAGGYPSGFGDFTGGFVGDGFVGDGFVDDGFAGGGFGSFDVSGGAGFGPGSLGAPVVIEPGAILFDPEWLLPAPALRADVIDVRVEPGRVGLLLEGPAPDVKALHRPARAPNYVQLRGGALRIGKLLMERADVQLYDASPGTPFEISLWRFHRQLAAGRSELNDDLGLTVTLPDYGDLSSR